MLILNFFLIFFSIILNSHGDERRRAVIGHWEELRRMVIGELGEKGGKKEKNV
jgi:hypothetical protein